MANHNFALQPESTLRTRTVYVAREDREAWADAVRFCKKNEVSLSRLIADALRYYLDRMTVLTDYDLAGD